MCKAKPSWIPHRHNGFTEFNMIITKKLKSEFRDYRIILATSMMFSLICANYAHSGEVITSNVHHDNGRFTVHSNMLVHLHASYVRKILTDFENLPRINANIKGVNMLAPSPEKAIRMRVESEVCALLVCLDYSWVQEVSILPSGDIITHFDPALSDFREGWVRYQLVSEGAHTRLITDAVLVPDFWFPPLIGPILIKGKLRSEALEAASRIEATTPHNRRVIPNGERRFLTSATAYNCNDSPNKGYLKKVQCEAPRKD
jgi:hypothetical protein